MTAPTAAGVAPEAREAAVEAAARALFAFDHIASAEWEHAGETHQNDYRDTARVALNAAEPFVEVRVRAAREQGRNEALDELSKWLEDEQYAYASSVALSELLRPSRFNSVECVDCGKPLLVQQAPWWVTSLRCQLHRHHPKRGNNR